MCEDSWYCPAIEKKLDYGLCWEYCFAEFGGPTDTTYELNKWIALTKKYIDVKDFHNVCKKCIHCQWVK